MSANESKVPHVLLTNDDGIDAPGLAVLETVAAEIADEVWVVVPEHDQSGTSHSISLHSPLRVSRQGERRFGVAGTPGDCVVMGVRHLMRETLPTLILSGVNRDGGNLGVETMFSGTVGAAMTGLLLGLPSFALSQTFSDRENVRWDTARALAPGVIRHLLAIGQAAPTCLNINFPDVDAAVAGPLTPTRQDVGLVEDIEVLPHVDPRGIDYHWLRFKRGPRVNTPDSETAVVAAGGVSVTPLAFDQRADVRALRRCAGPALKPLKPLKPLN
ncbi:MAG: 5'-nucleotidase SurE (EC [uncultured Paraburkholderia sp.]|nr:MAG: 5'-nucleotidase SurE (EC [uncultured Paraburkholderia sp.]